MSSCPLDISFNNHFMCLVVIDFNKNAAGLLVKYSQKLDRHWLFFKGAQCYNCACYTLTA